MKTNPRGHQRTDMGHPKCPQAPRPSLTWPFIGEKHNRKFNFTMQYTRYNRKGISDKVEFI